MMYRNTVFSIAILMVIMLIGCSGSGGQLPSMPDYGKDTGGGFDGFDATSGEGVEIRDVVYDQGGHITWGLFQFILNPTGEAVDIVQLRTGAIHLNAIKFLEPPPGVYLSVGNIHFSGNILDVDVSLRHPFLGLTEYTGFDVTGIMITSGSYSGFSDTDIVYAGPGDTRLLNPDGHSRWWNPVEFPENPDAPIFGYIDGLMGVANDIGNYNSTLNAYKYFCDDLDDPSDPMSDVTLVNRGMFSAGMKNTRHYKIEMGAGLVFNYAVDANWKHPSGNPPWDAPEDFGLKANRVEPWNISVLEIDNSLYFEESTGGGGIELSIDVYDWQNAEMNTLYIETANGIIPQYGPVYPTGGGEGYSTYEIDIDNTYPVTAGDIDILITVETEEAGYQGLVPGMPVCAYLIYPTEISDEGPEGPIDDKGCYGTAIAIDENNVIHSAYADKENLYWSYSTNKGNSWTNMDSIYQPSSDLKILYNSLMMSAGPDDGFVYISWAESAGSGTYHRAVMAGRMPTDLSGNFEAVMCWEKTSGSSTNQHYDNTQIIALENGEFLIYSMFYAGTGNFNPVYYRSLDFPSLESCPEIDVNPTNGYLTYIYTPYTPSLAADSNSDVFFANSGRFGHDGNATGSFLLTNSGNHLSNTWSFYTSYHHAGSNMYWDNRSNGIVIDESDVFHWVSEYQVDGTGAYGNLSGTYSMVYGEGPTTGETILQDPIPNMVRSVPEPYENAQYDYEWICTSVVEDGNGLTYIVFQDCVNRRDAYYITYDGSNWYHTEDWVKINIAEDQNAYMPYAIRGLDGYVYVTYTDLPDGGGPGNPVFMKVKD
jgi:hypothetical protein